jgi:methionine-gamma-lyase
MVQRVFYIGQLDDPAQQAIYDDQCLTAGAMLSFTVKGGEAEAFRFLNHLKLVKLAVSLGSTESLAEHPASMTHAGVDPGERTKLGITPNLVRLSVGVEHPSDLIHDLGVALSAIAS